MPLDQIDVDKIGTAPVEKEMTFLEHLEELRWHIIRSLVAIVVIATAVFLAKDWVTAMIFAPTKPEFITYDVICDLLTAVKSNINPAEDCMSPPPIEIITPKFGEKFITFLKISIVLGFIVSFPYIFWEFWRFIKPGLYDEERKAARGVVVVCSLLFLTGVCFGFFVVAPFAVTFLAGFDINEITTSTASFSSYISYITMFTVPIGIVFELPVVVFFLSKVGLITPEFMKKYRRHAFVLILIAAAAITPPDVITQFLIGIPLYALYEVSIIISRRVVAKQQKEWEEEGKQLAKR
ncbi:MAG: twin-arginine translocase subunit TatC [Bacteroidota bacterium]